MELSRPVVVQRHGHLKNGRADWHGTEGMWVDRMLHPLCDFQLWLQPWPWPWIFKVKIWKLVCQEWNGRFTSNQRDVSRKNVAPILWLSMSMSPMTLTLDFQGQILKMFYLRNPRADWHGTKRIWVDRMLNPLCDFQLWPQPWLWPWIFTVKFGKTRMSGMGWPIDMESKGCESIECLIHVMTFNFPLTHDLDLGFSRSNLKKFYLMNGMADWHGTKGCELIECWTHVVTFNVHLFHDLDLGFSRSNLEKVICQEWDGWLTWNERDVGR